jgi:Domain of unknown function (DUF4118)
MPLHWGQVLHTTELPHIDSLQLLQLYDNLSDLFRGCDAPAYHSDGASRRAPIGQACCDRRTARHSGPREHSSAVSPAWLRQRISPRVEMRCGRSAGCHTCATGAGGMHSKSFAPRRQRYRFAFLAVGLATGCVGLLMALLSQPVFVLYIVAIAASTWYGGGRTGLVAVALALFASTYLFIPPYFSFTHEQSILPLLVFYCSTVVLTTLVSWHRARPRDKSTQSTRPLSSNGPGRHGHHNDILDPGAE